jgi:glycosyltransferase involved in cell wall biosynthesis
MKIAVYSHYFVPEIGAPSMRFHDLAREWIALGDDVDVFTCLPNHPSGVLYPGYKPRMYQFETIDGIRVHRQWTYMTRNRGFLKKTVGHVSFYPSAVLSSRRHLDDADVIIGTSPTFFAAMAAARVARKRRRPFVMEVRDLWPAVFVELGVLRNRQLIALLEHLELRLYRQASRVVTVTESFRRNLIERGVPAEKVVTVSNGANIEFWDPAAADPTLRSRFDLQDRTVVLYVGAHGISQRLSAILDAASLLRERRDIVFLFVGEGAEKPMLVERAKGLDNVRFFDSVDTRGVRDFYAAADICLVPLRNIPLFETFIPSKMFEIMAMARPIVASVAGEAAEILERSGGARVVAPEDSAAIAAAVETLADDRVARETMGRAAAAFVRRNYSRHELAARYREVLADAIGDYKR